MLRRRYPQPALFPDHYTWLVFLASMDIMMPAVVIDAGGIEANALARAVLHHFGLPGMVLFKFLLITLIILLCQFVGQRNKSAGRFLVSASIALNCLPVALAFALLIHRL